MVDQPRPGEGHPLLLCPLREQGKVEGRVERSEDDAGWK